MKKERIKILQKLKDGYLTIEEADDKLIKLSGLWLSPIDTERKWQEDHIKKIYPSYPTSCPKWQILNGLIRSSCIEANIEIIEP